MTFGVIPGGVSGTPQEPAHPSFTCVHGFSFLRELRVSIAFYKGLYADRPFGRSTGGQSTAEESTGVT